MAHRSNLIQVQKSLRSQDAQEQVIDPVCQTRLSRREVRHMLFRSGSTFYFCSRECRSRFKPGMERQQREPLRGAA